MGEETLRDVPGVGPRNPERRDLEPASPQDFSALFFSSRIGLWKKWAEGRKEGAFTHVPKSPNSRSGADRTQDPYAT